MATLQDQLTKAKLLKPALIRRDLYKFIRSIEKEFVDRNKKQINEDSKDILGNAIGFYSEATEKITTQQALAGSGKPIKHAGDPFTGKDTGSWLDGFYMQEVSSVLRFGSTDPKTNEILGSENWLSHELFGLSDENLKEVIDTRLLPFLIESGRKILDL